MLIRDTRANQAGLRRMGDQVGCVLAEPRTTTHFQPGRRRAFAVDGSFDCVGLALGRDAIGVRRLQEPTFLPTAKRSGIDATIASTTAGPDQAKVPEFYIIRRQSAL